MPVGDLRDGGPRRSVYGGTLPFALTREIWTLYLLGFNQSVASGVGFIATAGVYADLSGAGSEVMSRIAASMIGGMLTSPLLSMFVLSAAYSVASQAATRRPSSEITPASQQRRSS